jgi:hypothetical protein
MQNIETGSSTKPVVNGMDGLARMLTGMVGGYMAKKGMKEYKADEAQLMAERKEQYAEIAAALGMDQQPAVPPAAPMAPPMAAPEPPQGVNPQPPAPTPPLPVGGSPQPPPGASPAMAPPPPGASPAMAPPPVGGPPPVGPPQPPGPPVPGADPVMDPSMPQRPNVPKGDPSVRLRLGMMMLDNPYSFTEGVDNFNAGIDEEARNRALRQQREYELDKGVFEAGVGEYYGARSQKRGAKYDEERSNREFGQQLQILQHQQSFQADQADIDRAQEYWKSYTDLFGVEPPGGTAGALNIVTNGRSNTGDVLTQMVGITLGAESNNRDYAADGSVLTSPKGAKGRMQVMDGTNRDPGFGVTPAKDDSLEERARVGRDYLAALLQKYGTPEKAWAAYNWGPSNFDAAYAKHGENWMRHAPDETRKYVSNNVKRLNGTRSYQASGPGGRKTLKLRELEAAEGTSNRGKALPSRTEKTINDAATALEQWSGIATTYDDKHFGFGTKIGGKALNMVQERFGAGVGTSDETVAFWKNYNSFQDVIRNSLYGATFTKGEQIRWDASQVTEATRPELARKRLAEQERILRSALSRTSRSAAVRYDNEQIRELIGDNVIEFMGRPSVFGATQEVRQQAGKSKPTPTVTVGGKSYTKLPDGNIVEITQAAPKPRRKQATRMSSNSSLVRPEFRSGRKPWWADATVPQSN